MVKEKMTCFYLQITAADNNAVMHYLTRHTHCTTHKEIQISFMILGLTKFAPDRFFGLIKKKFRVSNFETMLDMAKVVCSIYN